MRLAQRSPGTALAPYLRLMRLHRPVGTLLLLWPTLAALWIAAKGVPPADILAVFVIGTFLARSAGCVVNDIADRKLDGHVRRTRQRPLPQGEVSVLAAWVLAAVLALLCLALASYLNRLALMLAMVGGAVACLYPFLKRWTHLPQAALGVAFSWGIPMAFAAVTGDVAAAAWLLFAASLVWIVAYDTLYAMVDRADDLEAGIKSSAILFGRADRMAVAALQAAALGLLVWLGVYVGFANVYNVGIAVAGALFLHQQRLIRDREESACFRAFRNNVWVGFALFAGTAGEYAWAGLSEPAA